MKPSLLALLLCLTGCGQKPAAKPSPVSGHVTINRQGAVLNGDPPGTVGTNMIWASPFVFNCPDGCRFESADYVAIDSRGQVFAYQKDGLWHKNRGNQK